MTLDWVFIILKILPARVRLLLLFKKGNSTSNLDNGNGGSNAKIALKIKIRSTTQTDHSEVLKEIFLRKYKENDDISINLKKQYLQH